jgi:hypothetical protein
MALGEIDKPRVKHRFATEITGVAAIKNQKDVRPSSLQVRLDMVPGDMAELLSYLYVFLFPSSKNVSGSSYIVILLHTLTFSSRPDPFQGSHALRSRR